MPPVFFVSKPFVSKRMKTGLLLFLFAIFVASLALPQSTTAPKSSSAPEKGAPKKAGAKTASAKTASGKTVSTKTASTRTASTKTASSKKGKSSKKSVRTAAVPRQLAPTPERYRDIQQALVDTGYLKSEPNGVWDAQSTEALRQFQTDRNLSPTGKISAASLIGLGLGPKTSAREASSPPTPRPPEASPLPTPSIPTPEN
jgi:hypothetical protein